LGPTLELRIILSQDYTLTTRAAEQISQKPKTTSTDNCKKRERDQIYRRYRIILIKKWIK